jgi:serine O-acetyltransferase
MTTESAVLRYLRRDLERSEEIGERHSLFRRAAGLAAPGVQAVAVYRLGTWALGLPPALRLLVDPLYWVLDALVKILWGIEISRHATIGPGLYIGHFGGITIGKHVVLGANCSISQQITVGAAGRDGNYGAPVLGDNVYIAPGARVFGRIRIGHSVKIGANAVVHADVPDNAVVALTPGFEIISYYGNRQ